MTAVVVGKAKRMSSFGGTTTANGPNASSSTTEQAKEKAQEGAQQAKRTVSQQVDQRSTQAGERVGSTAQDIRSVSEELRKQGKDQPAKLAEQAAQRAESLGDYLQRSDGDAILRDIEDFGRQRPWAVIAGGVALGFAASRFLKASSSRRYESSPSATNGTPGLTAGAPTTRTGMAPGDAGYGQTGPGYPGRDPLAGTRVGGTPATGAATGAVAGLPDPAPGTGLPDPAPGTGLYTDGERGA
jgi:broad specificity phosphatase PhoE